MDAPIEQERNVTDDAPSAAEAAPDLRPGYRIGRYEITGALGRGAMVRVYSARDTELGRIVALKFVAGGTDDERLIHEAQAASALNHPNIVTIHDVVREDGQTAIAMEFVEGRSLSQHRGTLQPAGEVIRWGRQIARALAATHSQGIVHGDIRPENLILRPDGYIKVLGFGLARRDPAASAAGDIFSLGCALYELLCGRYPFESPSPIDTGHAPGSQEPLPPADIRRDVSPALSALLLEMIPGTLPAVRARRKWSTVSQPSHQVPVRGGRDVFASAERRAARSRSS